MKKCILKSEHKGPTCVQHVPEISASQKNYLPYLATLRATEFKELREGKPLEVSVNGGVYQVIVVGGLYRVRSSAAWCRDGDMGFNDVLLQYVMNQVNELVAEEAQRGFDFMNEARSLKPVPSMTLADKQRLTSIVSKEKTWA